MSFAGMLSVVYRIPMLIAFFVLQRGDLNFDLQRPIRPAVRPEEEKPPSVSPRCPQAGISIDLALKVVQSHAANHEIVGYMPLRQEFETELDNDAELLVKDMSFNDEEETPLERGSFSFDEAVDGSRLMGSSCRI